MSLIYYWIKKIMKNKKEHILAFQISIWLLFFAFFIVPLIVNWIRNDFLNFLDFWIKKQFFNRYIVFSFAVIFIYFLSYFLARKTLKPIEENNKKLKEYNHNLAHELKTPLSVIKSDLELLEIWKKFDLELIKSSKEEIISMQEIIDSLLFLSQKQNNLQKEKINLFDIINEKIDKKNFIISKKNKEKIYILAERKLIEILLKNLIENALKYWKKNEKIEIFLEDKKFIIKNKIEKKFLKIDKEKIFEIFYKWDNSRHTSWYWLWLNIVKKIIILHNFKIYINIENNFFIVKIVF